MTRDPFVKEERECPRRGCEDTVEGYEETIDLAVDMHLADHDEPMESQPGWPRGAA